MATLLLQIELGDCVGSSNADAIYQRAVEKYLPKKFHFPAEADCSEEGVNSGVPHLLKEILLKRWSELRGRSALDCVRIYLNCTRRWPLCGARLLPVTKKIATAFRYDDLTSLQLCKLLGQHASSGCYLAVAEEATELLEPGSMRPLLRIPHKSVITFGGHKTSGSGPGQLYFMLLVNGSMMEKFVDVGNQGGEEGDGTLPAQKAVPFSTSVSSSSASNQPQRLLFPLPKRLIVEVTMLLADYITLMTNDR